jgi:hypothetical protein
LQISLLSDYKLVTINLNNKRFKRFWGRPAKYLALYRKSTSVAGTQELIDLFIPSDYATQMSADF